MLTVKWWLLEASRCSVYVQVPTGVYPVPIAPEDGQGPLSKRISLKI